MATRPKEDEPPPVSEVVSKLREFEDYNLALSLQEQEFGHHYNLNRTERKIMGVDTKKSKEEQMLEKKYALEKRIAEAREIAIQDEEIARQFQREIEAEEARRKVEQARIDEELAKRLQLTEGHAQPITSGHDLTEDERIARELQERYLRRLNKPNRRLDEEVQNQLNTLVSTNTLPSPQSAGLPPLPSYREAMSNRAVDPSPIPTNEGTHFPVADPIDPTQTNHIGFMTSTQHSNIGFENIAPPLPTQPRPRVHFASEMEAPVPVPPNAILEYEYDTRNIPQSSSMMPITVSLTQTSSQPEAIQENRVLLPEMSSNVRTSMGLGLSNSLNHPHQASVSMHAQPLTTRSLSNDLPTPPPEVLAGYHPTNPFLQDILRAQNMANGQNQGQAGSSSTVHSNGSYHSEFGLPPPSSLVTGPNGRDSGFTDNLNVTITGQSGQKKIPTGGVRMLPPDSNELARRLPRPSMD